jgi:hypothetical protein
MKRVTATALQASECSKRPVLLLQRHPGFVPYPPPCAAGDILGYGCRAPRRRGPTGLPGPFRSGSIRSAPGLQPVTTAAHGPRLYPGRYGNFHLSGDGHPGPLRLPTVDAGVYTWYGNDYSSDANGKPFGQTSCGRPMRSCYSAPGTSSVANPQFLGPEWRQLRGFISTVTNSAAQEILSQGRRAPHLSPPDPGRLPLGVSDTKSRPTRWGDRGDVRCDTTGSSTRTRRREPLLQRSGLPS